MNKVKSFDHAFVAGLLFQVGMFGLLSGLLGFKSLLLLIPSFILMWSAVSLTKGEYDDT